MPFFPWTAGEAKCAISPIEADTLDTAGLAVCRRDFAVVVTSHFSAANAEHFLFRDGYGLPAREQFRLLELDLSEEAEEEEHGSGDGDGDGAATDDEGRGFFGGGGLDIALEVKEHPELSTRCGGARDPGPAPGPVHGPE